MKSIKQLGELKIIQELVRTLPKKGKGLVCGIGDDCAVIKAGAEKWLVTTDLLQQGVHFDPSWFTWEDVGYKAIQVNLSDIAAMGGEPLFCFLTIALPSDFSLKALKSLSKGINRAARKAKIVCAGGDTNRSPHGVVINVTVIGKAKGKVVYRHGAKRGDDLYVTGYLGEAALGLALLSGTGPVASEVFCGDVGAPTITLPRATRPTKYFCNRQTMPEARLKAGQQLAGLTHAMIDVSDGLAKDLGHLINASQVGAEVHLSSLRSRPNFEKLCKKVRRKPLGLILGGGEDYELLFAAPPKHEKKILSLSKRLRLPITKIGKIVPGRQITYLDSSGHVIPIKAKGYEHF